MSLPSRVSSLFPWRRRVATPGRHRRSVLAWPAWLRVACVLPVLVLLWLAVAWAGLEIAPW